MAVNGTISQTTFTSAATGGTVKAVHLTELRNAINKLQTYGKNVDNCGNCTACQTCQTTSCQGCQSCQKCQTTKCQSCQSCQSECDCN